MSYEIKLDEATGIAHITMTGATDPGEMLDVLNDLASEGEFTASKRLWNLRNVTGSLTSAEVEQVARAALLQDSEGTGMVAIVATNDVVFGMSRVFEVFRESDRVAVQVFRDVDTALRWLQEDGELS